MGRGTDTRRKAPEAERTMTKLQEAGFTEAGYDAAISEAAAERGLTGSDAELFTQEAWAEMLEE